MPESEAKIEPSVESQNRLAGPSSPKKRTDIVSVLGGSHVHEKRPVPFALILDAGVSLLEMADSLLTKRDQPGQGDYPGTVDLTHRVTPGVVSSDEIENLFVQPSAGLRRQPFAWS